MSLLRIPSGQCRAHTLCLCQVGRGKGGCLSGCGHTTHSWHDGPSHVSVRTNMDAYRVICHPDNEDEGARWARGAQRQRGPVEITSRSAPATLRLGQAWLSASSRGGIILSIPWLARLVSFPNGRVAADGSPGRTDDGRIVRDFKLEPTVREV